jgi:hypothetical protein
LENAEVDFDAAMQKKMRTRILSILLYWKSQGWVSFTPAETPTET